MAGESKELDKYHTLTETTNEKEIDNKIMSFYHESVRGSAENDIYDSDTQLVTHINLKKVLRILSMSSKDMRSKQKRSMYLRTPDGTTLLHVLAHIVHNNGKNDETIDDAFIRLCQWKDIDPEMEDNYGWNTFNHLVGGRDVRGEDIYHIYNFMLDKGYLPNKHDRTSLTVVTTLHAGLIVGYYDTITQRQILHIMENMTDDLKIIFEEMLSRVSNLKYVLGVSFRFLNYLFQVSTEVFIQTFEKFMNSQYGCKGCVNKKLDIIHLNMTKVLTLKDYKKYDKMCGNICSFYMKDIETQNGVTNILESVVKCKHYDYVLYILNRFYKNVNSLDITKFQLIMTNKVVTQNLIDDRQLDIITLILKLMFYFASSNIELYMKNFETKIDCTDKDFTCAICWDEFKATDAGYAFPKCGHYPFCETCFTKIHQCPYCGDSGEDVISFKKYENDVKKFFDGGDTIKKGSLKLYDVSYCHEL